MRAFITIDLIPSIREKISYIQQILKGCDLNVRWVNPDNVHLTLKFLGEINEESLEQIKKIMTDVAEGSKEIKTSLESFGFFPNERKPRVFFVSTTSQETLKSIADELEDKLQDLGFKKESKFKSHITLARIKSIQNIDCLKEKIKDIDLGENLPVNEIILYESTLTPEGPIYDVIFKARFAS